MIDFIRQVPAPGAAAWLIEPDQLGTPFVVLCLDAGEARRALAAHLLAIGTVADETAAQHVGGSGPALSVAVVW